MGKKKSLKIAAIVIILVMVFLIFACFKLLMEGNEYIKQIEELEAECERLRIEVDRRTEALEKYEDAPDEYLEEKAYEQGYRKSSDSVYINDMPES